MIHRALAACGLCAALLSGCAGNSTVPADELADVPGTGTQDTGPAPVTCPSGQNACGTQCFDLTTDVSNCGACGAACAATQTCSAGACHASCAAGQSDCGGACVDTQSDPANCGACSTACAAGQVCSSGACRAAATCTDGQTDCGGGCIDAATSAMHCGACGHACASGESCMGGTCTPSSCPSGQARCVTACVDTTSDLGNCGACGHACASGESCSGGACTSSCAAPRTACADGTMQVCVDLTSDSAHCGVCTTACSMGQRCTAGRCVCPTGQTSCGGACVDTQTDAAHCGSCTTACGTGSTCTAGACTCPTGRTSCSGACVNTQTDAANCGSCAHACGAGSTCSAGACSTVCPAGQTQCSGRCVNVQTNVANCGACGTACAAGQTCAAGACHPANDARASAVTLTLGAAETTVTGTTAGATHDGPTVPCGCTSGADVWYRFTLAAEEVVYLDTAGSTLDTSLSVSDASGAAVPAQTGSANTNVGLCNDDGGCAAGTGGFTSALNSRTAGVLAAGTYYVAVGGCGTGAFTLHVQHVPTAVGSFFYRAQLQGDSTASTILVGASRIAGTCGGTASGEDVRWFTTCGGAQQFFSLCQSDGGTYLRHSGSTSYDPSMYLRAGLTGAEIACNDDGTSMGGTNCQGTGTGADTANYGSRLNNVTAPRGLHALVVDERTGGSGMTYTLRYIVR